MGTQAEARGGCLCGAVRYRVAGGLREVVACHCGQCRRTSGHFVAATQARRRDLAVTGAEALAWYTSSPGVRRGFCSICGGNLFWDKADLDTVAITAGTLDSPTGLRVAMHIFVADQGDYYDIDDDLPKQPQGGAPTTPGDD